jgi:hypothetical protein
MPRRGTPFAAPSSSALHAPYTEKGKEREEKGKIKIFSQNAFGRVKTTITSSLEPRYCYDFKLRSVRSRHREGEGKERKSGNYRLLPKPFRRSRNSFQPSYILKY